MLLADYKCFILIERLNRAVGQMPKVIKAKGAHVEFYLDQMLIDLYNNYLLLVTLHM